MSNKNSTPIDDFFADLNGGVLQEKVEMFISQIALATSIQGGKKKGKLILSFTFEELNDSQLMLQHKIEARTPTRRGHKLEVDTTETPMFVGTGGRVSVSAPKEDAVGQSQFELAEQQDGPAGETVKNPTNISPLR